MSFRAESSAVRETWLHFFQLSPSLEYIRRKKLRPTRGYGLLEKFLAKQRIKMANKLIPSIHKKGKALDIGCGVSSLFLANAEFSERYGLDKVAHNSFVNQKVIFITQDIERENSLPFESGYFDVVTMLGVLEHIGQEKTIKVLKEIHRILKPNGIFIMTTPAFWTEKLLKVMSKLRLVSPVEIKEHKSLYNPSLICFMLQNVGFLRDKLKYGYFEMFANVWVAAVKSEVI